MLAWMGIEWWHRGKPSGVGIAAGAVAGLAAITPASGYVPPWASIIIGAAAGIICYLGIERRPADTPAVRGRVWFGDAYRG